MNIEEIRRSLDSELHKIRHSSGTHDDLFNEGYECALRYVMEHLSRSLPGSLELTPEQLDDVKGLCDDGGPMPAMTSRIMTGGGP